MYNNINQRFVNRKNRIQNFYNLLIIFLAADGGDSILSEKRVFEIFLIWFRT